MKSKTVYKRGGVVYKVIDNNSVYVYNKEKMNAVTYTNQQRVKPQKKYSDLTHITDEELKGLNDLVQSNDYTTLKQRINTLAGQQICTTCPGSNSQAKALVKNEVYRRNIT